MEDQLTRQTLFTHLLHLNICVKRHYQHLEVYHRKVSIAWITYAYQCYYHTKYLHTLGEGHPHWHAYTTEFEWKRNEWILVFIS